MIKVRYFDGKSSKPHDLLCKIESNGISLYNSENKSYQTWSFADIKIASRPEDRRDAVLTHRSDTNIRLVASYELYKQINSLFPSTLQSLYFPASTRSILAMIALGIIIIAIIYGSIPYFAKQIANNISQKTEDKLGNWSQKAIMVDHESCQNKESLAALNKLSQYLIKESGIKRPIHLSVIKSKTSNAMAISGGRIIIFSELIKEVENESQLAAILAHELAHVKLKHPTQLLIRSSGGYIILSTIFGATGVGDLLIIANTLRDFQYSQEAESNADKEAIAILKKSGHGTDGLISFFKKMHAKETKNKATIPEIFSYISTHPSTLNRIKAASKTSSKAKSIRYLSDKEWQELKNICPPTPPTLRSGAI